MSSEEENNSVIRCWDNFIMYLKFAFAFINSCMVSMIQFLNRKSRDYRYVIQALEKEKKTLKVGKSTTSLYVENSKRFNECFSIRKLKI